eukprot:CAMPEP_0183356748 /NCGR_PEP_ID=MMETSP0164_2-20130417/45162_1 /TAXON_ID=221442 /ORGANISM="Coccolithus pelagicus ssp braarudi, Strain PLY182g" /LENGTH=246 /DNA_ID=CAMNT_0025530229 /DNA_START=44 /DNA_END=784 /DNA_ORIENTATION=+
MVSLTLQAHGKAVIVKGETKEAKDDLKALSGKWNGSLGGWIFTGSKRGSILTELRKKHTVTEDDETPAAASTSDSAVVVPAAATGTSDIAAAVAAVAPSSAVAGISLTVAPHKKAILVTGDTKAAKEQLKALGGRWNGALVGWVFPGYKAGGLLEVLGKDASVTLTVDAEMQQQHGKMEPPAEQLSSEHPAEPVAEEAQAEQPVLVEETELSMMEKPVVEPPLGEEEDDEEMPLSKRRKSLGHSST